MSLSKLKMSPLEAEKRWQEAVKCLTDTLRSYVSSSNDAWEYPCHTLWDAIIVLMDAYDRGITITLAHANWITAHRANLESYRERRVRAA